MPSKNKKIFGRTLQEAREIHSAIRPLALRLLKPEMPPEAGPSPDQKLQILAAIANSTGPVPIDALVDIVAPPHARQEEKKKGRDARRHHVSVQLNRLRTGALLFKAWFNENRLPQLYINSCRAQRTSFQFLDLVGVGTGGQVDRYVEEALSRLREKPAKLDHIQASRPPKHTNRGDSTQPAETFKAVNNTGSHGVEEHLFLVGCAVGKRVDLPPLHPGKGEPTALDEFIDALKKIGLAQGPNTEAIIETRDMLTGPEAESLDKDTLKKSLERFFDAVAQLPDVVRTHTSSDRFRWFKLGELLYGLSTSSLLAEQKSAVEPEERTLKLSILAEVSALESLVKRLSLPTELRQEVENVAAAVRNGEKFDPLTGRINDVAQAIFAWLKARA